MSIDQITSELLTTEEAAAYLTLSPNTLMGWRWNAKKNAPAYVKIGRNVRYPKAMLDEWIASGLRNQPDECQPVNS